MPNRIDWTSYRAVLWDLDGVVTPTASVHQQAWAGLFEDYGYTTADYLAHIDGKPRYDGVRSFLASRGIEMAEGVATDPPGDETVAALGNRKDEMFNALLAEEGVDPYPGTMAVVELLERSRVSQAIVSSSRNARAVLAAAGIARRFEVVVDGMTADTEHLAGKPDPAMFLRACDLLGEEPSESVVVEDAVSGVAAGVAGGFGLVLGINRGGNAEALGRAGAHLVTNDLGLTLPARSSSEPSLPTESS